MLGITELILSDNIWPKSKSSDISSPGVLKFISTPVNGGERLNKVISGVTKIKIVRLEFQAASFY